jgi:hypothetical protein
MSSILAVSQKLSSWNATAVFKDCTWSDWNPSRAHQNLNPSDELGSNPGLRKKKKSCN